jgi:archaeosine synthase
MRDNYRPVSNIFLLLPCSSRKPYSSSPSHKAFIALTKSVLGKRYQSLCQLIVTSPYGIVPREIESLIDYDIVVTGNWLPEEISRSRDILASVISKTKDPVVIAHLPENELDALKAIDARIIVTTSGHPLSVDSMSNLKKTLNTIKDELPVENDSHIDIRRLSEHLYGKDIFPENIYVKGKGIRQIFSKGRSLATLINGIRPTSGNFMIDKRFVDIDFEIKGDLFCVGVKDADDDIRAGDEVVIRNKDRVVAVGTAVVPGCMMKKLKKGKAVKIRKRFH